MRKISLFFTISLLFSTLYYSQNPFWSLPSSQLNVFGSQLSSLPTGSDYNGAPAIISHNMMVDENGEILFFIVDNVIYNKDAVAMANLEDQYFFPNLPNYEIIPVP